MPVILDGDTDVQLALDASKSRATDESSGGFVTVRSWTLLSSPVTLALEAAAVDPDNNNASLADLSLALDAEGRRVLVPLPADYPVAAAARNYTAFTAPARLLDVGRYIFAALLVTDKDASEPATITVVVNRRPTPVASRALSVPPSIAAASGSAGCHDCYWC